MLRARHHCASFVNFGPADAATRSSKRFGFHTAMWRERAAEQDGLPGLELRVVAHVRRHEERPVEASTVTSSMFEAQNSRLFFGARLARLHLLDPRWAWRS